MHRHLHHLARRFCCPFYSHKTRLLALLGPFADRYDSLPYPFIYLTREIPTPGGGGLRI